MLADGLSRVAEHLYDSLLPANPGLTPLQSTRSGTRRQREAMTDTDFVYTGSQNLEAMASAKNYNDYLIGLVRGALPSANSRILDFGSGTGTYADMLKAKGIDVECLELDNGFQEILRGKGYTVTGDIDALEPGSFDLIYALNVLEHIEDDRGTFAKLTKLLKPGGRIVIYVPAFQSLFSSMDRLVGHFRRYRIADLKALADQENAKIIKLNYCDPLGYAISMLFKVVGSKDGTITEQSVRLYDRFAFPASRLMEPLFGRTIGKNVVLVAARTQ